MKRRKRKATQVGVDFACRFRRECVKWSFDFGEKFKIFKLEFCTRKRTQRKRSKRDESGKTTRPRPPPFLTRASST